MNAAPSLAYLNKSLAAISTPAYVADEARLIGNMARVARLKADTGCKVLLATKAFAMPRVFPLLRETLDGTTASGLYEARLGRETFGKEVHVFSPAYNQEKLQNLFPYADSIYFNSVHQIKQLLPFVKQNAPDKKIGIRLNPGFSHATIGGDLYNPSALHSHFGVAESELDHLPWDDIDVLHAHSLCEALDDGSVGLINAVAQKFGAYISRVKTVNFGGGHFINKPDYNIDALIAAVNTFRSHFNVDVVFEPGGGLVYNAGYMVSTVCDTLVRGGKNIAVLDASASCHMPDVLEVPYTPPLLNAVEGAAHEYILCGNTCMTGDIIGTYSFADPLKIGDRLIFGDMLQYSFVKNNSFNGIELPDLGVLRADGSYEVVRHFGYEDYKNKLS